MIRSATIFSSVIRRKITSVDYYLAPTNRGTGDGLSPPNAAAISHLDSFIELARESNGKVVLLAEFGDYPETTRTLTNGGDSGHPVRIVGQTSLGEPAYATFRGTRAEPWSIGLSSGNTFGTLRLLAGANNLSFEYIRFINCGWCIRFGANLTNLSFRYISFINVQNGFITSPSGGATSANVNGLTIRDFEAHGYSKRAVRIGYNCANILIEDGYCDSEFQDKDSFAGGVVFDGTAHDIVVRRVTSINNYESKSATSYWNADGFSSEIGNYNITYEDCVGSHNTDAGFDTKSKNTRFIRCIAEDNKRNFRCWGEGEFIDCTGINPYKRGGSGDVYQLGAYSKGFVRIIDSVFTQIGGTPVFKAEGYALIGVTQSTLDAIVKPSGLILSTLGDDWQYTVFSTTDFIAPIVTSPSYFSIPENAPFKYTVTADKAGIVEITSGRDYSVIRPAGKTFTVPKQDYEIPLNPDNQIQFNFQFRDANNNRSILTPYIVQITDVADDPIEPAELFGPPGSHGSWIEIQPQYCWQDAAMTIPAVVGDIVAAVSDRSGFNQHAIMNVEGYQAILETDESGNYYLYADGYDDYYEWGTAGGMLYPQATLIASVRRIIEDYTAETAGSGKRRYIASYPRSNTDTVFNAEWAIGGLAGQTLWGRIDPNNITAATGGLAHNTKTVVAIRSTDGILWSNNSIMADGPDIATMVYGATGKKARLLSNSDSDPGDHFQGRFYGAVIVNRALDDATNFRVRRQLGFLQDLTL